MRVHHPRSLEAQQPRLFDLHPGIGDDVVVRPQIDQWLAKRLAMQSAAAQKLQRLFGHANRPHAMVNSPGPQSPLRHFKPAPLAKYNVPRRYAHICKPQMHMTMRGIVLAEHMHWAQYLNTRCVCVHHKHGVAAVFSRLRRGARHKDIHRAARIAGPGDPVLLAVENIVVAVTLGFESQLSGVGGGNIWLCHHIGRADFAHQQPGQPPLFHPTLAVALKHLHVARVWGRAIKDLSCQGNLTHLFGQVGVLHCRQPLPLVTVGQPKVPKPPGLRIGFQTIENLKLAICVLKSVAGGVFSNFIVKLCIQRRDIGLDHIAHLADKVLYTLRHPQIHGFSSRLSLALMVSLMRPKRQ